MHNNHEQYINQAAKLAEENILKNGDPFAAISVKDGEVVATGCNRVTHKHDATAHAEVEATRNATQKLDTLDLGGCDIYLCD